MHTHFVVVHALHFQGKLFACLILWFVFVFELHRLARLRGMLNGTDHLPDHLLFTVHRIQGVALFHAA